ncbi:hypothetical protein BC943DRAFT_334290 [Umbelopsis sp. AD052]|nr:hypothetical protein BC943DRAFT_334290 [Umbelopsis sp. AD052]
MFARKALFIVFILIVAALVSAQDEPGETQKVGDVANSNPFDEAVNHDGNDGNKAQIVPVINTTGSFHSPPSPTKPYWDDFTPVTVAPSPSVTKSSAGQHAVLRNISQTSFLVRLTILLTAVNLVNSI